MQHPFKVNHLNYLFAIITFLVFSSQPSSALLIEPELKQSRLGEITSAAQPGDGTNRMFLILREGSILIWDMDNDTVLDEPFLDIEDKVITGGERGLLGIAFHPNYADNGQFYLHYSTPSNISGVDHLTIIAEFTVSDENPNLADPESEREILVVEQPERNHNAGQIKFGPDGMLYIGMGDGGGSGDQHGQIGNGQDLSTLLGSMLRIDVDNGDPYAIPDDNPFVDDPDARDEIWAYGFRNPWKFSFDRETGDLFVGDVGQNEIEEVDILESGGNYGWRIMEGSECFNPSRNCDQTGLILPIAEYTHDSGLGISITGGYVYRGTQFPSIEGKYIFGDFTGTLMFLEQDGDDWILNEFDVEREGRNTLGRSIYTFAEDRDGEIYVISSDGSIFQITVPEDTNVRDWKKH